MNNLRVKKEHELKNCILCNNFIEFFKYLNTHCNLTSEEESSIVEMNTIIMSELKEKEDHQNEYAQNSTIENDSLYHPSPNV